MEKAVVTGVKPLHAPIAAAVVRKAYELEQQYRTPIFFQYKDHIVPGVDFVALVNLPIKTGAEIWVLGEGEQSGLAIGKMAEYLERCFQNETLSDEPLDLKEVAADKQLKKAFQAVLDSIPDGIGLLDEQGYVTWVNANLPPLLNQQPKNFIGSSIDKLLPAELQQSLLAAGAKGKTSVSHAAGGMAIMLDISPIRIDDRNAGSVLVIKDDRKIYELNEQLQSSLARLEFLEQKQQQSLEAGWSANRMKSESLEQKMLRTIKAGEAFTKFIGMSPKVLAALELAGKAAKVQSTVLVYGKSGTGKELIAEGIHYSSPRSQGPFIRINCAAIPANLVESELFGHEKGAFTGAIKRKLGKFELAHKGTLFLDEIGEMESGIQTKLLRVLQSNQFERVGGEVTVQVNVRIIAATNQDMEQLVKNGQFREDLFYRLNVIPIYLPPLQERKEDIPLLVDHFLKKYSQEFGKQILGIKKSAMDALIGYDWPGNVRELQNIIERIVVLSDSQYLEKEDIPLCCLDHKIDKTGSDIGLFFGAIEQSELFPLAEYEKQIIRVALERYGSYTAAGKVLGITHKTVAAKAQKYGIDKT